MKYNSARNSWSGGTINDDFLSVLHKGQKIQVVNMSVVNRIADISIEYA